MIQTTLIIINIPKTGGSSLGAIVNRQYPKEAIHSVDPVNVRSSIQAFKVLPAAERQKIRLLRGHIGFGLHPYLRQPCAYLTLLRHPVSRLVSHYAYVRRTPYHYLYEPVTANGMTLQDYVSSGLSIELNNGQTRLLAGAEGLEVETPNLSAEILEFAKNNLRQHFLIAGLTEQFDQSLWLIKQRLGWKNVFYTQLNVSANRPEDADLPCAVIQAIQENNQLDFELYAYAENLHAVAIAAAGLDFQRQVQTFQALNKLYNKLRLYYVPKRYRSVMRRLAIVRPKS